NRVDFAGRKGFLKIARDARVAVVPMGIRGSHYTAPILWRSEWLLPRVLVLPWAMGARRFPLTLLGSVGVVLLFALGPIWIYWLTAVLAWLVLVSPVSQIPWVPATITAKIGAPIPYEELFPDASDEAIDGAYARVVDTVQALVRL